MGIRLLSALLGLVFAVSAQAFSPRTGIWWNPSESGSGYTIEVQDGVVVVLIYSYKSDGDSEWYISSGTLSLSHSFTGPLNKVRYGQCISCGYANPTVVGSDGTLTINFTSEVTATLYLPGGRITNIRSNDFGYGSPPQGLLGEWVFVENIGSSWFADHYNFTTKGGPTSTGNGIVMDLVHNASCELKTSGTFAGYVLCFHWSSSSLTTVADQYQYRYGLDKTFEGIWISPTSYNQYPMKGHLWAGDSGAQMSSVAISAPLSTTADLKPLAEQASMSTRRPAMADDATANEIRNIAEEMRGVLLQHQ